MNKKTAYRGHTGITKLVLMSGAALSVIGVGLSVPAAEPTPFDRPAGPQAPLSASAAPTDVYGIIYGVRGESMLRGLVARELEADETAEHAADSEGPDTATVEPDSEVPQTADEAPTESETTIAHLAGPYCRSLGPIESSTQLEPLADLLAANAMVIRQRQDHRMEVDGYLVVSPRQATPEATRRLASRLQKAGIRDFSIIQSGILSNRISLGFYGVEKNASERATSLRNLGFEAQIRPQGRTATAYWLDLELARDTAGEGVVAEKLQAVDSGLSLKPVACSELTMT